VTSTGAFAMTTAVIIHHSSLRRARTLPSWQFSSRRCPNHQPQRDGKPTGSYAPSSSVLRCSRPKAPRPNDADLSLNSLHSRHHARRRLQSTRNNRKRGTSPRPSTIASATTTMRATFSTCAGGTRRMVPAVATTFVRAVAMTVGRTGAHLLNPQDLGSSARTFATHRSRHGSGNLPRSLSMPGRQTPSSSLTTTTLPC
jgi:hypothetical protein